MAFAVPDRDFRPDGTSLDISSWMQAHVQLGHQYDCLGEFVSNVAWTVEQRQQPIRL